ncbi:MAG: coproporphyrinogen III oxidase, partial [Oscillospiraceae bacterium]
MSSPGVGIYLHVPFCDGKCPYCDFYSLRGDGDCYDRYLEAMLSAIETAPLQGGAAVDTVYFGGGTP